MSEKIWPTTWQQAQLEEILPGGKVRCHLSPRNCVVKEGRNGFCGVRGNRGGRLVTMNFGKSVHLTEVYFGLESPQALCNDIEQALDLAFGEQTPFAVPETANSINR